LNYMVWSTQKRKETIVNRHCKVSRKNWSVPLDYVLIKMFSKFLNTLKKAMVKSFAQ